MNRLGFNQEPPLPAGMMGTRLHDVLKNVPGSDRFMKRTLRALAEYLNAVQTDVQNLIGRGGVDTTNMEPRRAGILQRALNEISQGLPSLRNAIERLVQRISQGGLDNILNLPMMITGELLGAMGSIVHGLFSMGTNGGGLSIMENSLSALWNLVMAIFQDAMSSPAAMSRLMLKMVAPGPVARFL